MMNAIRNGLLSLVMSREAREKMEAYAAERERAKGGSRSSASSQSIPSQSTPSHSTAMTNDAAAPMTHEERAAYLDDIQKQMAEHKQNTSERQELIRNAMRVHKAKQSVLNDLSDEQRQKLVAMALQKLMNKTPEDTR